MEIVNSEFVSLYFSVIIYGSGYGYVYEKEKIVPNCVTGIDFAIQDVCVPQSITTEAMQYNCAYSPVMNTLTPGYHLSTGVYSCVCTNVCTSNTSVTELLIQ